MDCLLVVCQSCDPLVGHGVGQEVRVYDYYSSKPDLIGRREL